MKKHFLFAFALLPILGMHAENKAIEFDPVKKSYLEVPFFTTPQEMTLEAWINTTQTGTGTIIAWKDVQNDGESCMFRIQNGKLQYGEWINSGWSEINSNIPVNIGSWIHVAVVRKGNEATLYINGHKDAVQSMNSSPMCKTDNLKIGALGTVWQECFQGQIDEVRIWSKARTEEEIQANFLKEISGKELGLEGYWKMDGTSTDSSTHGRNAHENEVTYVDSDIFNTEVPIIESIEFIENKTSLPHIRIKGSRSGILDWAICPQDAPTPSQEELISGSDHFLITGHSEIITTQETNILIETDQLKQGEKYKLFGQLHSGPSGYSKIEESPIFEFQGLSCLPLSWKAQDIGTVSASGSAVYDENEKAFTVKGSGSDVWWTSDSFYYTYQSTEEQTDIKVHITPIEVSSNWAKYGLMLRKGLEHNDEHIFVCLTPSEGANQFVRSSQGGSTSIANISGNYSWVRMIIKDGWVATYVSTDSKEWIKIGMNQEIGSDIYPYIGLAVCAHDNKLATIQFDQLEQTLPEDTLSLSDRGLYFAKKKYIPEAIPVFKEIKDELPRPVLTDNPEWTDMYYKAWEIAFSHIKSPQPGSPLVSNFYDEAFDSHIFQWDMIFMTLFGRYADHIFPGINSLDNFYCRQHESGCITRCLSEDKGQDNGPEDSDNIINPPLFSWAEMMNYEITGDTARLALVLPVLEKYYEFVENKRRGFNTPHQLYWNNGQASGMDNLPRDEGRPGGHHASDPQGWVDMSSQMVIQCRNISKICSELARFEKDEKKKQVYLEKSEQYNQKVEEITALINKWLWNEEEGIYYDVDTEGKQTGWKTIAAFWPMLAEVTSKEQAERLITHLQDTSSFWRDNIFPALSADEEYYSPTGAYWCGGVWAPSNYAVLKGLEKMNANDFAYKASLRYLRAVYDVYKETGTFWENYAPELINGAYKHGTNESDIDPCRRDFVGWTGLAPISVLIENILGFHIDAPNGVVTFNMHRLDKHGIENLHFGKGTVTTILADARNGKEDKVVLSIESNESYLLKVIRNGQIDEIPVKPGKQQITLDCTAKDLNTLKPIVAKILESADCVGGMPSSQLSQLKKIYNDGLCSDFQSLYEAYQQLKSDIIPFEENKIYQIIDYKTEEGNQKPKYLEAIDPNGSNAPFTTCGFQVADYTEEGINYCWCFIDKESAYLPFHLNAQAYLGNQNIPLQTQSEKNAAQISFQPQGYGRFLLNTSGNQNLKLNNQTDEVILSRECIEEGNKSFYWLLKAVDSLNITIPEAQYKSIYLPFSIQIPQGLCAYYGKEFTGHSVVLEEIQNEHISAYTPIILQGAAGCYPIKVIEDASQKEDIKNLLKGCLLTSEKENAYLLSDGKDGIGFYFLEAGKFVPQNTAYIQTDDSDAAKFLILEKETTSIHKTPNKMEQPSIFYDLNGIPCSSPHKGIYIDNKGKKHLFY